MTHRTATHDSSTLQADARGSKSAATPRDIGCRAEAIARRALEAADYLIVETNWVLRDPPVAQPARSRRPQAKLRTEEGDAATSDDGKPPRQGRALGELDVIAWHGGEHATLCFIEVRSRANADHGHAAEMIDRTKRARVSRMAGEYLHARGKELYAEAYRFDAVAITGDVVDIIQDAWRLGIAT